jgi:DUF971 family protein
MTSLAAFPTPIKISKPAPYLISFEWSDGRTTTITLRAFRDACPCASCKGETIMGKTYTFGMQVMKPGMYELVNIQAVGNYAIQADWKDGHNTGIYSWDILRGAAEEFALSDEQICALAEQAAKEGLANA